MKSIKVTVWNEFINDRLQEEVIKIYPQGIHEALAGYLRAAPDLEVATATLHEPERGLTEQRLTDTDVLLWWGHAAHNLVEDEIVERVHRHVLAGMGLILLHSAHFAKIFKRLMGTSCNLKYREADDREIVWVISPGHPIAAGIRDHFILPVEEMYGEYFDIPMPDEIIFISSFTGGEVFRSGVTFQRGAGRIFYFRPGHESHPTYHDKNVLRVIENGVRWAAQGRHEVAFGRCEKGWLTS